MQKTRDVTTAAGSLLSLPSVLVLSAVFILAAWYRLTGILLLTGLFVSMAGLSGLWSRLSLVGVSAERHLDGTRRFPGETVVCRLRLVNRKPLPLPWVAIESALPPGFTSVGGDGANADMIRRSASLLWYRSITWTISVACPRRGFYRLPPPTIVSGDMLGLYPRRRTSGSVEPVVVYPRIYPVDTRIIPSIRPMGDFRGDRRLFRDPTHTIGVREYDRRDSLRLIHWKATARRGDLQVRVPAATTAYTAALVLDIESFTGDETMTEVDFELAISAAGSIAAALVGRGSPVGLYANTRLADTGQSAAIHASAAKGRLTDILETLAKTTARRSRPLDLFLEDQKRFLPAGTTVVVLVGRPPSGLPLLLAHLAEAGLKRLVLQIGDAEAPVLPPGTPHRRIRRPDDLVLGAHA